MTVHRDEPSKMACIKCGEHAVGVTDSRVTPYNGMRRRRSCEACGHRWTTVEYVASEIMKPGEVAHIRDRMLVLSAELMALADRLVPGDAE